ncbi:MAG: FkbM family methyltransferase [Candidatus Methanomethylicia archaeon]
MKARISDFIVVKFKYSRFIELILHFIILLIPLSWIYLISRFTKLSFPNTRIYILSKAFVRGIVVRRFNGFLAGLMFPWSLYVIMPEDGLDMQPHVWIWNDYERIWKPRRGDVVIDIGAHVGLFTLKCIKVFNVGRIIAIEPHPVNYLLLNENLKLNNYQNIANTLRVAVGGEAGSAKLYLSRYSFCHSLVFNEANTSINVQLATLDDLVESLKLQRVDFIKIDVEGYEVEVLKGMINTLTMFKPVIVMEVLNSNIMEVKKILSKLGYNVKTFPDLFTQHYYMHCLP